MKYILNISILLFLCLKTATASPESYLQTINKIEAVFKKLNNGFHFDDQHLNYIKNNILFIKNAKQSHYKTKNGHYLGYFYFPASLPNKNTKTILWAGGLHSDEFTPVLISWKLLLDIFDFPAEVLPKKHNLIYVPMLNIDGWVHGSQKYSYPTRKNMNKKDLNRSFYNREKLPHFKSEPEVEFALDLIEKYRPTYWIIPHSSFNILDLDGAKTPEYTSWVDDIFLATTELGGQEIPIKDFPVYASPNRPKNWSMGKLASHLNQLRPPIGSLTLEFGGPGVYPSPNDPNYSRKVSKRKHLGRYEDNTYLADGYYTDYLFALKAALKLNHLKSPR